MAGRRCRPTPTRSRCGSPSTSTPTRPITEEGIARLVKYVVEARAEAEDKGCTEILAFATSAVRDAVNVDDVIARVNEASGVDLEVLAGDDEARLTFLAVRRWFGWSAGRLGVFDIGGGSLEMAAGSDEIPDVAQSLPLGAGRLTREWLDAGRSPAELRLHVRSAIADEAGRDPARWVVRPRRRHQQDVPVARAHVRGGPVERGPVRTPGPARRDLSPLVEQLAHDASRRRRRAARASRPTARDQIHAGAIVAEATMDLFDLTELEICPWALREGVLLEHLDHL